MLFFNKYFFGKGLNLTNQDISKYSCVKNFKIAIVPKYNFIVVDFENITHQESDLYNFSRALLKSGKLIIRQKITHEECYNEIFYHAEFLSKENLSLINYESDEEYNYFIFNKHNASKAISLSVYNIDRDKLFVALKQIANSELFADYFIALHINGDNMLWLDKNFVENMPKFSTKAIFGRYKESPDYNENAFNWNRHINICKTKQILLINDDFDINNFSFNKKYNKGYIFIDNIKKARKISGIDFKYKTLDWCIYDFSVRMKEDIQIPEYHEQDSKRFLDKKSKGLVDGSVRWINIHEALGDNICAFNLLESLKRNYNLMFSTAYPFLYELSGDLKINSEYWELINLGFNIYEHGSENKCKTLEYAYFSANGEEELYDDKRWKYFLNVDNVEKIKNQYKGKNLVLIAPSASNREGPSNGVNISNKSWDFKKWEQIVSYLQSKNYYVIQVGVKEDFKVENVNEYFFNKSFGELTALIVVSKFFMGLDTFFQHLCGLMGKKGIVVTPAHNDHAFWPSAVYIVGKINENFEHLKWIKDHLNPHRAPCMQAISYETVKNEVDKILDCFNKY